MPSISGVAVNQQPPESLHKIAGRLHEPVFVGRPATHPLERSSSNCCIRDLTFLHPSDIITASPWPALPRERISMLPSKPRSETSTQSRPKTKLNARLDHHLIAYMTAASAAGVALLAAASPAAAEVVFTPTNTTIGAGNSYLLDLNNDGIPDFTLRRCASICGGGGHTSFLMVDLDVHGNAVASVGNEVGALPRRTPIGPRRPYLSRTSYGGVIMARAFQYSVTFFNGPWANATNRFLGLKFLIDGQVHYGWARLTVTNFNKGGTAILTGYAYETVPNQRIFAGERGTPASDSQAMPAPLSIAPAQPASLAILARGADALELWRRREPAAA
jgi:hypothetical protein